MPTTPAAAPDRAPCPALQAAEAWFAGRGWLPFAFQREVWAACAEGRSGLLHATTGAGKTYAVGLGAVLRAATLGVPMQAGPERAQAGAAPPLGLLWITPMRALAADTQRALAAPLADLAPAWSLGLRSGDTGSAERARQDRRLPTALVTTPESATLLLTKADARALLRGVHTVVVDEWHEMVGNKRGVQVQLLLARLQAWNPRLVVWGLSATLGNLPAAMAMLLGPRPRRPAPRLVRGRIDKALVIDTLLPAQPGRFSWGGHLGAQMQQPVADEIARTAASGGSTLVFTNVRSQAEAWYQLLLAARPEWAGEIALHHGSLDKGVREWVEAGLKAGRLKAVVATSSLDLGVDFLPVERVLQIGSAKGVARLLQRAGRSGHQPGRPSRITLVPTNTLELIEAVAARRAVAAGRVEPRQAPEQPLDVLVQHLVTVALGGGFAADSTLGDGCTADALYDEVRRTWSYRALPREAFQWALDFVVRGGASLGAYPEYHRVVLRDGVYRVEDRGIALRHRLQVGTIVGESSMLVKWFSSAGMGGTLGQIEEGFIARLNKGDCFVFGGRVLEYVRTQDMVAFVKKSSGKRGLVPSWQGGKMPLSSELADATLAVLAGCVPGCVSGCVSDDGQADPAGVATDPELQAARPMLQAQARLSRLPTPAALLLEQYRSREGHHLFIYPFAGRFVHLGLASLLGWRLARERPNTFSISINDYGFELLSADAVDIAGLLDHALLAGDEADGQLLHDVLASLNSSELALRRFREIARVAGLVFTGYPGAPKSTRQLQASSGLFYEVFRKYDPANRLLGQADAEVLAQELDLGHLAACLARLRRQRIEAVTLPAPSPFALALMVERFREQLSTEKLADRLARMVAESEAVLDAAEAVPAAPRRRRAATAPRSPG
ncbi:ligase-associated DNA damage response DEXH box helicase [Aquabacterium sp. OR-4]|uniref:ligase-associated DNA damage response DEXH box helicase n=1 Tax=Aquabacterium sp. OR-4 TaxID=2978127 RepID=UPI0021B3C8A2|nr:ligase-associated DNA damage response DEXH box helicase [Aquabacterium sp. OR-4]MDT7836815.1 ligase-associated DNA damage response DEXH box helicase [Aquabacterium sp. OR-4]